MKKCPFCAEEIQDESVLCRYCKSDLCRPIPTQQNESPIKTENGKTIFQHFPSFNYLLAGVLFYIIFVPSFYLLDNFFTAIYWRMEYPEVRSVSEILFSSQIGLPFKDIALIGIVFTLLFYLGWAIQQVGVVCDRLKRKHFKYQIMIVAGAINPFTLILGGNPVAMAGFMIFCGGFSSLIYTISSKKITLMELIIRISFLSAIPAVIIMLIVEDWSVGLTFFISLLLFFSLFLIHGWKLHILKYYNSTPIR